MRKILETISLGALAFAALLTWSALTGPHHLPDKIPTHFDSSGHANGWDSSTSLVLLPLIALSIYLLITVISAVLSRFPELFNFPVQVTEENRPRLQALAFEMIAWIKAEMVCLFAWVQWMTIQAARMPDGGFSSASGYMVGTFGIVAILLGTIGWFLVAMLRAAQTQPVS